MKSFRLFLFLILSCVALSSQAATTLPKNMNKEDRLRALEILGLGSATKILGNPYPLGGYSGLEVGLASEFIPLEDLSGLGNGTNDSGELNFYTLTFTKGIYHNIDTMVYFSPITTDEHITNFGVQLRWGFYEAQFFPVTFSFLLYGGGTSFSNLLNVSTVGGDLIATVNVDNVALYLGGGQIRANGQFVGGTDGITDTGTTMQESVTNEHMVFGVNISLAKFFLALEVDRYVDSIYSGKIGFRF